MSERLGKTDGIDYFPVVLIVPTGVDGILVAFLQQFHSWYNTRDYLPLLENFFLGFGRVEPGPWTASALLPIGVRFTYHLHLRRTFFGGTPGGPSHGATGNLL